MGKVKEQLLTDHEFGMHSPDLSGPVDVCPLCNPSLGRPSTVPPSDVDVPAGESFRVDVYDSRIEIQTPTETVTITATLDEAEWIVWRLLTGITTRRALAPPRSVAPPPNWTGD